MQRHARCSPRGYWPVGDEPQPRAPEGVVHDELLTRGSEGLRLTPRAVTLAEPVRTTLARIQALVARDEAFDPATVMRLGLIASGKISGTHAHPFSQEVDVQSFIAKVFFRYPDV